MLYESRGDCKDREIDAGANNTTTFMKYSTRYHLYISSHHRRHRLGLIINNNDPSNASSTVVAILCLVMVDTNPLTGKIQNNPIKNEEILHEVRDRIQPTTETGLNYYCLGTRLAVNGNR